MQGYHSCHLHIIDLNCMQGYHPCSGCGSRCGLYNTSFGTITDGSGLSEYSSNANCSWMIVPSPAAPVAVIFTALSTEEGWDFVRVWQCSDASCTDEQQLIELSGSYSVSQTVTATTGFMKITFTSDADVNGDGFTASWASVRELCALRLVLILNA